MIRSARIAVARKDLVEVASLAVLNCYKVECCNEHAVIKDIGKQI